MSREIAERHGRRGEGLAAWWLRLQGWRIVAHRLRRVAAAVEAIAHRYLRAGDNPRIDVLLLAPRC
ncbi:MAG: hypothetical protein ACXU61_09230 [Croceibacterium sp.]